jgi:alpha,alpha-trehalase
VNLPTASRISHPTCCATTRSSLTGTGVRWWDRRGDCAWLCFPSWSDAAVFASLIGSAGQYLVQPAGRWVWGGYYEDGTLIWTSRWVAEEGGAFESRDALACPGDPDRALLLRRLRTCDHEGEFVVALDVRPDYGRKTLGTWRRSGGCWEARGSDVVVRWWGAENASVATKATAGGHHRLNLRLRLDAGKHHDLVLELLRENHDRAARTPEAPDVARCWLSTEEWWRHRVPDCSGLVAAGDVRRSLAVLHGMTGPGGGTVAAATTSLPERADTDRNYDYRYVWVRDTSWVGRAAGAIDGAELLLDGAVRWVAERLLSDGDRLVPAYRADGGPVPDIETLDLPGYPGGTDVIGNRIGTQFQLDAFGEALQLFARAAERERLDRIGLQAALTAVGAIERRWQEADSGLWELDPKMWTQSRLACVAGLRALCRTGIMAPTEVERSGSLADRILSDVTARSVHPSGRWQRAPDDDRVDASLLLAQIRGAMPPDDARSVATRRAVTEELSSDGYVYRYRQKGARLGDDEGAFLICNFWLAMACLGAGEVVEGVRWFERSRSSSGSPGLLAEEYDVEQHQLRGNLPQAFVHAALVECAAMQSDQ